MQLMSKEQGERGEVVDLNRVVDTQAGVELGTSFMINFMGEGVPCSGGG